MINTQTEQIIKEVVSKLKNEREEKENHFKAWGVKKVQIDEIEKYSNPREREIWWVSIGYNIGSEIFGKGKSYSRPVLVINADNKKTFVGIPLTSKAKAGKYSPIIKVQGKINTALTFQIRNFDKKRLISKMCILDESEYMKVKEGLETLFKI